MSPLYSVFLCYVLCLFHISPLTAQKSDADRLFDRNNFYNAIPLYQNILERTPDKVPILERLLTCYYNLYEYQKGIAIGEELMEHDIAHLEHSKFLDVHFKYAQLLAATGDYQKSMHHLNVYRTTLGNPKYESKDIVAIFKLRNPKYAIERAKFNSSPSSDFGAIKMNDSIVFVSDRQEAIGKKYAWTQRKHFDIFVSPYPFDEDVNTPQVLPHTLNGPWHEGPLCFGNDGNTIYFTRSNSKGNGKLKMVNKSNTLQLYISHKQEHGWSPPKKLPFCDDNYNYMHPTLNKNGDRLLFASDGPDSNGSYDIYEVAIKGNHQYGTPKNLGNKVNSSGREQFPYLSESGDLYFSSDGHIGFGFLDVFRATQTNGEYNTPENLGTPINSKFEDFSFIEYEIGKGFFSTNRNQNDDEIYKFVQIAPFEEEETTQEILVESTMDEEKTTVLDDELKSQISESDDGRYFIDVEPIYFNFNLYELNEKSKTILLELAEKLKKSRQVELRIWAHTDSRGSTWYNQNLSEKRAESVINFLVQECGLTSLKITGIGMGENSPFFDCGDDCTGWQNYKNRRCNFEIIFNEEVSNVELE